MNAAALAHALGGKRSGRQWAARCPAHEDKKPSLIIYDGRENVQVRCLAGCAPEAIIAALKARGLWVAEIAGQFQPPPRDHDDREARANARLALDILNSAEDAHATAVEAYLMQRKLIPLSDVLKLSDMTHVMGFHAACPRGRKRQPALIAAMRDFKTDKVMAIQRIFLTPDAKKDGAMMLGPTGGCAMKITPHSETFSDELGTCANLHICEGLETGLALLLMGYEPLWALGSAGAIARFPVLPDVDHLTICADNDAAGLSAAEQCQERWTSKRATIWVPDIKLFDFADLNGEAHGSA